MSLPSARPLLARIENRVLGGLGVVPHGLRERAWVWAPALRVLSEPHKRLVDREQRVLAQPTQPDQWDDLTRITACWPNIKHHADDEQDLRIGAEFTPLLRGRW